MVTLDGRLAVVFNGEIYNFPDLRRELIHRGHTFRTRSDTEVILHAYETWGPAMVEHLRGMFAIAIYDAREPAISADGCTGEILTGSATCQEPDVNTDRGRLMLFRDRFGIKPLYYALTDTDFLFASEVRTLLASGKVSPALRLSGLLGYLVFGSVYDPETLIEAIDAVLPGHVYTVEWSSGSVPRLADRWHYGTCPFRPRTATAPHDVAATCHSVLQESVRVHLTADVPVGVFLSSGLDSTAVAILARSVDASIRTYTVGFPEEPYNEAERASAIAHHLGLPHQVFTVHSDDVLRQLDAPIRAMDQPTMDGVNTYFISWAVRSSGLKVALSGLGGDELFGGYPTFFTVPRMMRMEPILRHTPAWLHRSVPLLLETIRRTLNIRRNFITPDGWQKLGDFFRDPDGLPHPYFYARALWTPLQVRALLRSPELWTEGTQHARWWRRLQDLADTARQLDAFHAVSWLEMSTYMLHTLLRDTDFMSMAHSLEVRVPFVDHVVAEWIGRLPGQVVLANGIPKALLRKALAAEWPPLVLNQRKRGFTFPWEVWLRTRLRERVETSFHQWHPALKEWIHPERVWTVWTWFLQGRTGWSRPWALFVLNEWVHQVEG